MFNEYDIQIKLLRDFVNNPNSSKKKVGKSTAKLLELYCDVAGTSPSKEIKHILAHYRVRKTREGEIKRREMYLGDFDYKTSPGYKLIERLFIPGVLDKRPNANMLKSLILLILNEERKHGNEIKLQREALRSKSGLYKFITDHYTLVEEYLNCGTKITVDQKLVN